MVGVHASGLKRLIFPLTKAGPSSFASRLTPLEMPLFQTLRGGTSLKESPNPVNYLVIQSQRFLSPNLHLIFLIFLP